MPVVLRDCRHVLIALIIWLLAGLGVALIDLAPAGGEAPVTAVPTLPQPQPTAQARDGGSCPAHSRPC